MLAPDGEELDFFGTSVSISGNTVFIGASGDDDLGFDAGAVYRFHYDPISQLWGFSEKLLASDGGEEKRFGRQVATSGIDLLVGTSWLYFNDPVNNPGTAYFLTRETGIDCNGNGVADGCDIETGVSQDLNGDGVPDECVTDCNGNGVNDAEDIAEGRSQDINLNGLPDECEPDCDGNGLPDAYELANGLGTDCNLNLVFDACEVACIPGVDINNNQIHDACETQAFNDTCQMSMPIFQNSIPFTNAFTTASGFTEPCGAFDSDVWFRYFHHQGVGRVTVSVCDANFDTELAIYEGFSCPMDADLALACSDDDCGTGSSLTVVATGSTITHFMIRVGGKNGQQGTGTLVFSCEPLCPEDVGPQCGDGVVDEGDLMRIINAFGGPCAGCREDIAPPGGNGVVNIDDLVALLGAFGPCP